MGAHVFGAGDETLSGAVLRTLVERRQTIACVESCTAGMLLGALSDPHPGFCYRLYNLWREQRTHGYRPSGAFTAPTGGDWATLRAHAAGLSRSAGAP